MLIKNGLVFNLKDDSAQFIKQDLFISKDKIVESVGDIDQEIIDANGLYVIPGLIDLHFHGCVGYDFCDATQEALAEITKYEAQNGVTSVCPATLTLPIETLEDIGRNAANFIPLDNGAMIVGIHFEGPFFSANKIGAQNPKYLHLPDIATFEKLQTSSNNLGKILSLSPEQEGACELICQIKDKIRCSVAHTSADYDTALLAYKAGAKHTTHLFNAMPPFLSREPGVIGAAFDSDGTVEIISDGTHLHPSVVRATIAMFGDDRVIFISDSMMATGLDDGEYSLGGLAVVVVDGVAKIASSGSIAGSTTNLMDCLKTAVQKMGIPLETAVKCSTINPAKALGLNDKIGSLEKGKTADIVLLNKNLEIVSVIIRGNKIF